MAWFLTTAHNRQKGSTEGSWAAWKGELEVSVRGWCSNSMEDTRQIRVLVMNSNPVWQVIKYNILFSQRIELLRPKSRNNNYIITFSSDNSSLESRTGIFTFISLTQNLSFVCLCHIVSIQCFSFSTWKYTNMHCGISQYTKWLSIIYLWRVSYCFSDNWNLNTVYQFVFLWLRK
jgi:hypothetical protein